MGWPNARISHRWREFRDSARAGRGDFGGRAAGWNRSSTGDPASRLRRDVGVRRVFFPDVLAGFFVRFVLIGVLIDRVQEDLKSLTLTNGRIRSSVISDSV